MIQFNASRDVLTGGTITLGGAATVTANSDATDNSALAGTAGLVSNGKGNLTLGGANTFTVTTVVTGGGMLAYVGAASSGTNATNSSGGLINGGGGLTVANSANSVGFVTVNATGNLHFATAIRGDVGSNASGVVNHVAGNVVAQNLGNYLEVGRNGSGSYTLAGGTLTTLVNGGNKAGIRVGNNGGTGSFTQTGGTLTVGRYLAIGAKQGTTNGIGVVTFTGGAANIGGGGYRIKIGDGTTTTGQMNLGTEAGGSGIVILTSTSAGNSGIAIGNGTTSTGILNLNSGTVAFNVTTSAGAIYRGIAAPPSTSTAARSSPTPQTST